MNALPEDRPVGGYCKLMNALHISGTAGCQRIDPLEGTASVIFASIDHKTLSCCQRIDPLEGTARNVQAFGVNFDIVLPEDRPVGGYCKIDTSIPPVSPVWLPEDRPVGGYCKIQTSHPLRH